MILNIHWSVWAWGAMALYASVRTAQEQDRLPKMAWELRATRWSLWALMMWMLTTA